MGCLFVFRLYFWAGGTNVHLFFVSSCHSRLDGSAMGTNPTRNGFQRRNFKRARSCRSITLNHPNSVKRRELGFDRIQISIFFIVFFGKNCCLIIYGNDAVWMRSGGDMDRRDGCKRIDPEG